MLKPKVLLKGDESPEPKLAWHKIRKGEQDGGQILVECELFLVRICVFPFHSRVHFWFFFWFWSICFPQRGFPPALRSDSNCDWKWFEPRSHKVCEVWSHGGASQLHLTLMMTSTEVVETSFSQKSSPGLQSPGVIEISKFFNFREIHKTSVIDTEKPAMF